MSLLDRLLVPSTLRALRGIVLFLAGLAGIGYETFAAHGERPTLLILFAAMVGLPAFLSVDERKKSAGEKKNGGDP